MNPGNSRTSGLENTRSLVHRSLSEDVLQSAQEDVLGEFVPLRDTTEKQASSTARNWLAPLQDQLASYTTKETLKASLIALAAGVLLALVIGGGRRKNETSGRGRAKPQA
jgi:hypothetical protein